MCLNLCVQIMGEKENRQGIFRVVVVRIILSADRKSHETIRKHDGYASNQLSLLLQMILLVNIKKLQIVIFG